MTRPSRVVGVGSGSSSCVGETPRTYGESQRFWPEPFGLYLVRVIGKHCQAGICSAVTLGREENTLYGISPLFMAVVCNRLGVTVDWVDISDKENFHARPSGKRASLRGLGWLGCIISRGLLSVRVRIRVGRPPSYVCGPLQGATTSRTTGGGLERGLLKWRQGYGGWALCNGSVRRLTLRTWLPVRW